MRSYEQYNRFFRLLGFGLLAIRRKFRVKYRYFSNKSNKSKCSARCIGFFWKGSVCELFISRIEPNESKDSCLVREEIIDILKLNEWKDNLLSLSNLLDNRKQRILKTIRNSEELREGAIEQLEKARARLRKVETEADRFRANGYSEIEREKLNLINSIYTTLEQFENYKNETIRFEQQRAINQVQLRVFQHALEGALGTLNSCLNNELHLRTISANIGMFGE
ncbi:hypothetical protein Lal_00035826 [Lupinus albus]|nr:hypothetical protein Lal_00035826 [Lupinus albus]